MRRFFLLLLLLLFSGTAYGQGTNTSNARRLPSGTVVPTNPCVAAGPFVDVFIDRSTTPYTLNVCTNSSGTRTAIAGGGVSANKALSNLASVSINTSLLAQTGVDLGSTVKPFRDLFLFGAGTYGTNYFRFTGTPTGTRVLTFQDRNGTIADDTDLALKLNLSGGTLTGNLIFTDNLYDIGASGVTRPRDFFLGRNAVIGGTLTYGGVTLTNAVTGTGKMVLDTSPTLITPALGTPASGVATNLTGTAAGLTAGNVTTNANLTGPITSVGNATAVAAQTGTGSTFVMQASPTLTTPIIGVATATSVNKVAITAPATSATLTVADGKTLTASNTLTLTATDGSTLAIGTGGTLGSNAYTSTAYAPLASPTFTGTVTIPTPFTLGAVSVTPTGTELNFVDGVTSAIQTQIDSKQATITFGTGVQTALGVNVGSAGAPVVNGGALGSPSSAGTLPAFTLGGAITAGGNAITGLGNSTVVANNAKFTVNGTNGVASYEWQNNGTPAIQIALSTDTYFDYAGALNFRSGVSGTQRASLSAAGLFDSTSLSVGSGTAITKHLSGTAVLDFANLAAIGCEDLTITVTGAALGDTVALGVPNGSTVANSNFTAWVSATNTVSVRFCALISGDPASGTFRVDVWQH